MDETNFDSVWSSLETMSTTELTDFVKEHTHDLTSCDFCNELWEDEHESLVGWLFSGGYVDQSPSSSPELILAMCDAIDVIWVTVEDWEPGQACTSDLMRLSQFEACTAETYEKLLEGFDWRFFRDSDWEIDDIREFLTPRASLPNLPANFNSQAVELFHDVRHMDAGDVEKCQECQGLIQELLLNGGQQPLRIETVDVISVRENPALRSTPAPNFCTSCGTVRTEGAKYCGSCGSPFLDA
jgi:hypothetical protein